METMTTEKLGEYLLFFAKLDHALIKAGFTKEGRKISDGIKTIDASWKKFAKQLSDGFYDDVCQNADWKEIIDHPPETYGKQGDDGPQKFHKETSATNTETLIYACKHVRNNLIHGEKLQQPEDEDNVRRNHRLLKTAQEVLLKAIGEIPKMNKVFEDIPY